MPPQIPRGADSDEGVGLILVEDHLGDGELIVALAVEGGLELVALVLSAADAVTEVQAVLARIEQQLTSPFCNYHFKRLEDQLYIIPKARVLDVLQVELDLLLHDDLDEVLLGDSSVHTVSHLGAHYTPSLHPLHHPPYSLPHEVDNGPDGIGKGLKGVVQE